MKYKILRSRKRVALIPGIWNLESQTNANVQTIHGGQLHKMYMIYELEDYTAFYGAEDWDKCANHLLSNFLKNKNYVDAIFEKTEKVGKAIEELSQKLIKTMFSKKSISELYQLYLEIKSLWVTYDELNVAPWFIGGDLFSEEITKRLEKKGLNKEDIQILLTPVEKSFSMEEEKEFLEILQSIKTKKIEHLFSKDVSDILKKLPKDIKGRIIEISENYYWMPFGYDGPEMYTPEYYTLKLKEHLKSSQEIEKRIKEIEDYEKESIKNQKEILKKYPLDTETLRLIKDFHKLAIMTDKRKIYQFQLHVCIYNLLLELGSRLGITVEEAKYLFLEEIKKYEKQPKKLKEIAKDRIKNPFVCIKEKEKEFVFLTGDEMKKLIDEAYPPKGGEAIKGTVASIKKEKIYGNAKIVKHPSEISKVKKGDILVSPMTTPEYVPAMRIASAIVTDEGGVTCHAAIVARELGIPCIIGTGNATKLLKDGDYIEVDPSKGTVKKVKK